MTDDGYPNPDDRIEHGADHAACAGWDIVNNARLGDTNSRIGETNSRIGELRSHMDVRFEEMKDLWRLELHRVEEVIDARLKHIEH
jgi:hypothetical protein